MKKELTGSLLVVSGAICYSVLAVFVKLAYQEGYTAAEVTFAQYSIGVAVFGLIDFFRTRKSPKQGLSKANFKQYFNLIIGGSTLGLTGIFYYFSIQYLPVSVCVVLLMQSTWMGVILEGVLTKTFPSGLKILGSIIVLLGTLLATDAVQSFEQLSLPGFLWGIAASLAYAVSIAVSTRTGTSFTAEKRSFYMLIGAFLAVTLVGLPSLISKLDVSIFWSWGLPLAMFGTLLPPLLFNMGMPRTGMGLSAILISVEIPASIALAFFLLGERISLLQWGGVVIILLAIVLLNYKLLQRPAKH